MILRKYLGNILLDTFRLLTTKHLHFALFNYFRMTAQGKLDDPQRGSLPSLSLQTSHFRLL